MRCAKHIDIRWDNLKNWDTRYQLKAYFFSQCHGWHQQQHLFLYICLFVFGFSIPIACRHLCNFAIHYLFCAYKFSACEYTHTNIAQECALKLILIRCNYVFDMDRMSYLIYRSIDIRHQNKKKITIK